MKNISTSEIVLQQLKRSIQEDALLSIDDLEGNDRQRVDDIMNLISGKISSAINLAIVGLAFPMFAQIFSGKISRIISVEKSDISSFALVIAVFGVGAASAYFAVVIRQIEKQVTDL